MGATFRIAPERFRFVNEWLPYGRMGGLKRWKVRPFSGLQGLGHYSWPELSRIIHMTTGLTWGKEEIQTMTRRVVSLCRAFNLREGMTRKDDCLPSRFHKEALPESGKVITEDELNRLMKDYYRLRGWE